MGAIFALSAQPDLSSGLGILDLVLRKLAHVTEYGLLWWLWARAFAPERPWAAAAIAVAYAITDEYHQSFVEGRSGAPIDVLVDAAGVAIAWSLANALGNRRPRERSPAAG